MTSWWGAGPGSAAETTCSGVHSSSYGRGVATEWHAGLRRDSRPAERVQAPIGSGFGPASTAASVLTDSDLTGRLALVTGGSSGIGLETTRALVGAGATVVVPARRPDAALAALAGLVRVEVDELDLADLSSVRGFAERFLKRRRHVDIAILGAGIMACPLTRTGPGWEAQFAVNHLGHYALVNHLWPALAAAGGGARIVSVSSLGHHRSPIRWTDVHFTLDYDKWAAYGQAKTANALFAVQLDAFGEAAGVRSFSVHPGKILTPLQRHMSREEMVDAGWVDEHGRPADATFKTPGQGAATGLWAATSPRLTSMGGLYCEDCDIAVPAPADGAPRGVKTYAADPDQAARLWYLSAQLTGVDAFH